MKGWPDYTRVTGLVDNYDEFAQNYPVGIGDGAARLGSIKTFDMRGRVWWMDDFEAAVLHWITNSVGIGGSQALSTAQTRNGNQSVKLVSNTGAGAISSIYKYFPVQAQRKIGIEASVNIPDEFGIISIILVHRNEINRFTTGVRIVEATQSIEYRNDIGNWIDTGMPMDLYGRPHLFTTVKFVVDQLSNEYSRILYNSHGIDLTGIPAQTELVAGVGAMHIIINHEGNGTANSDAYIDDVILTIMEPE